MAVLGRAAGGDRREGGRAGAGPDGSGPGGRGAGRGARAVSLLGALLLCAASGCVLGESLGLFDPRRPFNHRLHDSAGIGCADCHEPDRWGEPGWPSLDLCLVCHDDIDDYVPSSSAAAAALFIEGPLAGDEPPRYPSEVIFSHGRHAAAEVACTDCHRAVRDSESIDGSLRLVMADCTACHDALPGRGGCETCHTQLDVDVPPATHARQWRRLHGQTVRAGSLLTVDDCALCHEQQTCVACHLDEPPANHTNIFRLRTHGAMAAIDRDSCAVCHRSDSCVRCHEEVLPLSHHGAFGGTRSTHCFGCHVPLQQTTCFVCHKGTPSHAAATPLPPDHTPALNCRQCHGVDAPLPHVDNGDDCTICHR